MPSYDLKILKVVTKLCPTRVKAQAQQGRGERSGLGEEGGPGGVCRQGHQQRRPDHSLVQADIPGSSMSSFFLLATSIFFS